MVRKCSAVEADLVVGFGVIQVNDRQRTVAPIHDVCRRVVDVEWVIAGAVVRTVVLTGIKQAERNGQQCNG